MTEAIRILAGDTEPLVVLAQDRGFVLLTGLADLFIRIRRDSDGQYLDWNDDTFKAAGWTTLDQVLAEVDATNAPGLYEVTGGFDTSVITNANADDTYRVIVTQTAATAVIPTPGEIKVDQWPKDLFDEHDATQVDVAALNNLSALDVRDAMKLAPTGGAPAAGSVDEHLDDILTDTTAIDARLPSDPADESLQQVAHTQTQADIAALNDLAIAGVQTALTNQGYTSGRAPNLDNLDATVSSRSDFDETANPVELLDAGGVAGTSAAELVTDIEADLAINHGAGQWDGTDSDWTTAEREQIRFRLAMDGSQTDPTTGVGTLEDILADTDAVDTRLPLDPADESLQQVAHAQTQADVAALNNLSQADVQSAMTAQGYTAARAPNLDNLDATVSSRSSHSAVDVDTTLSGTHGAGSWLTGAGASAQSIRDAMKLAPTGGAPAAGSVDEHLDDILADTSAVDGRLPSDPADESNQLAQHTATQGAIATLNNLDIADIQIALTNQGYTAARAANLDDLDQAITTTEANIIAAIAALNNLDAQAVRDAMKLAPTGGAPAVGSIDEHLDDIFADTTAVDARLPTDPADESLQQASHTATQSLITALNNLSIADVQIALTNQGYTGTRATLLDNLVALDATITAVLAAIAALNNLSQADVQAAMTAQGYTTVRAVLLDNLDVTVSSIPAAVDAALSAAHGAGQWDGTDSDWTVPEREQIRGALGIVGVQTSPDGGGELQALKDQADKIDLAPTIVPASLTTGSFMDRMMNKDAGKTFVQGSDSLEAIRDRSG